jgi:acyl phosphate:glycerol-3-phosphate acyltransferase
VEPVIAGLAIIVGYLLGSISFTRVVGRFVAPGADLTEDTLIPSTDDSRPLRLHAVSATTLGNRAGPWAGVTAGILDVLKVLLPTLAFRFLYPDQVYFLLTATAGMVGHIWPIYYRFKGGRGLSAAYGGFLAIAPLGAIVTWLVGTLLGLLVIRDGMVTFIGWMWLMIPWLWFTTHDWRFLLFGLVINILFVVALIPEIKVYAQYRKEGIALSFEEGLQTTHMGRGLYKMAIRLSLLKEKPAESDHPVRTEQKKEA